MQWDFDLENIAYEHASRCVFEHGGLEGLNSTGQNIGASSNVDQTPVDLLKIWFDDETASFDLNNPYVTPLFTPFLTPEYSCQLSLHSNSLGQF